MLLVGVLMLITSLAMFAFPKRLPGSEQRKSLALANVDQVAKGPSLKGNCFYIVTMSSIYLGILFLEVLFHNLTQRVWMIYKTWN